MQALRVFLRFNTIQPRTDGLTDKSSNSSFLSGVLNRCGDELAVADECAELLRDGDFGDVVLWVERGEDNVHLIRLGGDDLGM